MKAFGSESIAAITPKVRARFEDLQPALLGTRAVLALHSTGWELKGHAPAPVILGLDNQPVRLEVERKGRNVSGLVVDFDEGKPVGGALVSVMGVSTNTDGDGSFDLFVPRVPLDAQFVITAAKNGWSTARLATGQITGPLEIRLRRPEPFTQVLRLFSPEAGQASEALTGALLELRSGSWSWKTNVGQGGQVQFPRLPRALLGQSGMVVFAEEGWRIKPGEEHISLSETPLPLYVEQTGVKLWGRVLDADGGTALKEASISIGNHSTTTDSNGLFRLFISGMPVPAHFRVTVTNAGWQPTNFTAGKLGGPWEIRLGKPQCFTQVLALVAGESKAPAPMPSPPPYSTNSKQSYQAASPADPKNALACYEYGKYLFAHQQPEKAREQLTQAADLAQAQNQLPVRAVSLNDLGRVLDSLNEPRLACKAYGDAIGVFRKLAAREPRYRKDLATCLLNRGQTLKKQEKLDDSLAALEDFSGVIKTLSGLPSAEPGTLAQIAQACASLGAIQSRLGNRTGALAKFEEAITKYEEASAGNPNSPEHADFANALNSYAICLAGGAEKSRAGAMYERSLAYYRMWPPTAGA